jgi:hypothetical protein
MPASTCDEEYAECIAAHRKLAEDAVKANPEASVREIAKTVPVSYEAIQRAKERLGVTPVTARGRDTRDIEAALMKNPTRRASDIAKELDRNESSVRRVRERLGIKPPPKILKPTEQELAALKAAGILESSTKLLRQHLNDIQRLLTQAYYKEDLLEKNRKQLEGFSTWLTEFLSYGETV